MKTKASRLNLSLNIILFLAGFLAVTSIAPLVQQKYFPIFSDATVETVTYTNNRSIFVTGHFKKNIPPKYCSYISMDASILVNDKVYRTDIQFYDQPPNSSETRISGVSYFGPWRFISDTNYRLDLISTTSKIIVDVTHGCGHINFLSVNGNEFYALRAKTRMELLLDEKPEADGALLSMIYSVSSNLE